MVAAVKPADRSRRRGARLTPRPAEAPPRRLDKSDDEWSAGVRRRIAVALATWLDEDGKAGYRVMNLTMREFEALAGEAVGIYGEEREKRLAEEAAARRALNDPLPPALVG